MLGKNYLPDSYVMLVVWLMNFIDRVAGNIERFQIPSEAFDAIRTVASNFQMAQYKAEQPNAGKSDRIDRDEKADTFRKAVRTFVNKYLRYNDAVTDSDRSDLGLTVPKKTHDPSPIAKTFPWIRVLTHIIRHLIIEFGGSETSRAKPDGQHGMEFVYIIGGEKPSDVSMLIHSIFDTRSPLDIEFREEDRGKIVWFAVRWENTRGQKGPWSEIYSAIIP